MKNTISLTAALLMGTMLIAAPAFAREGDDEDTQDNAPYADAAPAGHAAAAESAARNSRDDEDNSPFAEATPPAANEHATGSHVKASIPITSGGVGEEDMARMKSVQNQYNLKLLITEANGTFLSDVFVHIEDSKGHPLADANAEGPILLADLPPGKYKLKIHRHDEIKEKQVSVVKGKLSAYQITFTDTDPKFSGDPKTTSVN